MSEHFSDDPAAAFALDWLATRLDNDIGNPTSDFNIAKTWGERHWLKLKAVLEKVDPEDRKNIDKIFADYACVHHFLQDSRPTWYVPSPSGSTIRHPSLAEREARIEKECRYAPKATREPQSLEAPRPLLAQRVFAPRFIT